MTVDDSEIADSLRRTWEPFIGRFGHPTEVQRRVVGDILAGRDVLVCAPTASGKTEAACAPLVERRLSANTPWRILYVCPTRALVNDLYQRLAGPLRQLGVGIMRRTGDHRDTLRGSGVVITTPESFDSLLCRGRVRGGFHELATVSAVVLDEVHLLHGSARGEQVRWLIERLRRLQLQAVREHVVPTVGIQIVALSATVADPRRLADAFMVDPVIVELAGGRQIETIAPDANLPTPEEALPSYLRSSGQKEKVLVFSNARRRVDELAFFLGNELQALGYEVHAHHGSLAKHVREEAERAARELSGVVTCSTSTLEIGIDIGDIDLVVLDAPPPNVPALLQRIGRGNRRSGRTRVMACAGSMGEAIVQAAMIEMARRGELGAIERGPQNAVAIQQVASYILQGPSASRSTSQVLGLITSMLPEIDAIDLVRHFVSNDEFVESASHLELGNKWKEKIRRGAIHSTIESSAGIGVQDEATGTVLATGVRSQQGKGLRVGGHLLEVRKWEDYRLKVRRVDTEALARGEWSYVSSAWLSGAGQPQAVRTYLGLAVSDFPVLSHGASIQVFHFGGGRRRAVLELARRAAGAVASTCQCDDWSMTLRQRSAAKPAWLNPAPAQLAAFLTDEEQLSRLERHLGRPQANRRLPPDLRRQEVSAWLDLEGECEALRESRWITVQDPALEAALTAISESLHRLRSS